MTISISCLLLQQRISLNPPDCLSGGKASSRVLIKSCDVHCTSLNRTFFFAKTTCLEAHTFLKIRDLGCVYHRTAKKSVLEWLSDRFSFSWIFTVWLIKPVQRWCDQVWPVGLKPSQRGEWKLDSCRHSRLFWWKSCARSRNQPNYSIHRIRVYDRCAWGGLVWFLSSWPSSVISAFALYEWKK